MKLVSDSKNERITQLLQETDNYLAELGAKVQQQKVDVKKNVKKAKLVGGEGSSGAAGAEEDDDDDKHNGHHPSPTPHMHNLLVQLHQ